MLIPAGEGVCTAAQPPGYCVPHLLAAGTIDEGRTAILALSAAGVSVRKLEHHCDPLVDVITLQVRGSCSWHPERNWDTLVCCC